ncbi:hypothetical protein F2Q69_00000878 [Brassica cretica]|uniref:Uncharacterized protein n=1 Tax=Brassica cretica TaxID=69181 RepID=A0A8S9P2Y2_BRACR|nr:hypothetical protein F2Q69_00000878 [Brassica cretica]
MLKGDQAFGVEYVRREARDWDNSFWRDWHVPEEVAASGFSTSFTRAASMAIFGIGSSLENFRLSVHNVELTKKLPLLNKLVEPGASLIMSFMSRNKKDVVDDIMLRPFMKNFPQLGYKLQVTKKERIAIITSEALRRMQRTWSKELCFQLISIVAEPYLPHLEYLVQLLSPASKQRGEALAYEIIDTCV